jgi:predicted dehydrogenase
MAMGADQARPQLSAAEVQSLTQGIGVDAVLITAATKSDAPVQLAGQAVRAKGRVVAVGAVGLNLPRQPYYLKEVEFVVSCSYGPGRYDPEYEDRGHDYPAGYVRWTEQRNMQAVLDMMEQGRLDISGLITHRFPIDQTAAAYDLIRTGSQPYLGIVLNYGESGQRQAHRRIELRPAPAGQTIGVGCIGAGGFARMVLLPAIAKVPALHRRIICSASGLSASASGEKLGFDAVTAAEDEVLSDPRVQAVFILTRHHLHAAQVIRALRAGKHVFVEKPLALSVDELRTIESVLFEPRQRQSLLTVGFNRRFSLAAVSVKNFFAAVRAPLTVSIRFNAGYLPAEHWAQHEEIGGGRIIGEACHAIDLATFLVGSPPVRVFAEAIGGSQAPLITEDQCFITLRHANGSISNVAYLAGGDAAFPKERVEVLGGQRLAVIDDFREVTLSVGGKQTRQRWKQQDKGHQAEIAAFAAALAQGGPPPIAWDELRAVSLASILAVRSLHEGVPLPLDTPVPLAGPHFKVA